MIRKEGKELNREHMIGKAILEMKNTLLSPESLLLMGRNGGVIYALSKGRDVLYFPRERYDDNIVRYYHGL
jgi:hypothetical protein